MELKEAVVVDVEKCVGASGCGVSKSTQKKSPFYITTPIYYVNGDPHIGHVYTTLVGDIIARYARLKDWNVFYMTGNDCHGQKVLDSANAQGIPVSEFRSGVVKKFKECFGRFNMKYDRWIETTDVDHIESVNAIWTKIYDAGYIYKGVYEGWYSVRDEAFYSELQTEEIESEGKKVRVATESGAPVEWRKEENYMFQLSKFKDKLLEWYRTHPDAIVPAFRQKEIENFIEGGLNDLSVSRANENWGIPVPNVPNHSIYVWMDALTNYISGAGYPKLSSAWPADVHLIGKDIMKFHAIYWPAFLMAADIEPFQHLVTHGWWTKDGKKISKSLGNYFDLDLVIDTYGLDALRYFLIRESNLKVDADYSDIAMQARLNSDLADVLGNLVHRVRGLLPSGSVPVLGEVQEKDEALIAAVKELPVRVDVAIMENYDLQRALIAIWEVLEAFNKQIVEWEPWTLKGTEEKVARRATIVRIVLESLRFIATLLLPFIPESAEKILVQLGVPQELWNTNALVFCGCAKYSEGTPVGKASAGVLFEKYPREQKWEKKAEEGKVVKNPKRKSDKTKAQTDEQRERKMAAVRAKKEAKRAAAAAVKEKE